METVQSAQKVAVGSTVELLVNGEARTWSIVGPGQSDIKNSKISVDAPIIQAILGKKVGEKVECNLVGREIQIEIVEVF